MVQLGKVIKNNRSFVDSSSGNQSRLRSNRGCPTSEYAAQRIFELYRSLISVIELELFSENKNCTAGHHRVTKLSGADDEEFQVQIKDARFRMYWCLILYS
jgi:hypothetical protein